MVTLSLAVPNIQQVLAAGFDNIQVLKSTSQTSAGPYTPLSALLPLQQNVTSYTYTDFYGGYGDWYETKFYVSTSQVTSGPSAPQPAYLSDLCNAVRDLLGVTTTEVADSQIQGFSFLGSALARIHDRLPTFDTLLAAGGDAANLCLAALSHFTAALLCPRMTVQVLDSIQIKDYREQRNRQLDWSQTQAELMAKYELYISLAAQESVTDTSVYISPMALAGPTRAGYDTSGGLIAVDSVTQDALDSLENPFLPYEGNTDPVN